MLAAGSDSIMQLVPEIVSTLIRLIKTSSSENGLRAVAFDALRKMLIKQTHLKDEAVSKDLLKLARSGISEKSIIIQERSAKVIIPQTRSNH